MPTLIETLVAELERPREVSAQVVNHLIGTYGITRETTGSFLLTELPKLEDYEIDLILSPLFTPTLRDQSVFAELLGRDSVSLDQWPALIQQLAARPTHAQFITDDGQAHSVPLREVSIERFVRRLRLEATIPESLFKLLNHLPPVADRPMLKAVARRAVWENDDRRNILVHYLTVTTAQAAPFTRPSRERAGVRGDEIETKRLLSPALSSFGGGEGEELAAAQSANYRLDDVVELLKLAETYQPANLAELVALIPHWQQVLRQEINEGASPKPFFNERVQEMHGGGRDQRKQDNTRLNAKESEQTFLTRLQQALEA